MSREIRLHKEYGLNPTITQCFLCGEDKNEIALLGAAYEGEAPHKMCLDYEPCDKCKEYMKQGIILISVKNGSSGSDPYRTGGWCVVKEEAVLRWVKDPSIIDRRMMFVPDEAWDMIGLPRTSVKGE